MRILITGAGGFIGAALVGGALARAHTVNALVHKTAPNDERVHIYQGDVTQPKSLVAALEGCQAVIHAAAVTSQRHPGWEESRAVNVTGTANLIQVCQQKGVRRFLYVSSMSAFPDNPTPYGKTKYESEQVVIASGLDWTIVRPSIVYGPGDQGVFAKLASQIRALPVIPVIGSGRTPQRPVHVADVAWALLECLNHARTIGKTYMLGGRDPMTYKAFVCAVAQAQGKNPRCVHLPVSVAMCIAKLMKLALSNPPLTPDNVMGLVMAKEVDQTLAEQELGYAPRGFAEGLKEIHWNDTASPS